MFNTRLFPDIPFVDWVELWRNGYADEYGSADDTDYRRYMKSLEIALDYDAVKLALKDLFRWKDRFENRWSEQLAGISESQWNAIKFSNEVPVIWKNGAVYNVFLWHAATGGLRPIIDQHAWRAYCYLMRRERICDFPVQRAEAVSAYSEYAEWFATVTGSGIGARSLDQALMAFGQFCSRCPQLVKHWTKDVAG
jgi:hypothetical protein